jgi:hypothetical protein
MDHKDLAEILNAKSHPHMPPDRKRPYQQPERLTYTHAITESGSQNVKENPIGAPNGSAGF